MDAALTDRPCLYSCRARLCLSAIIPIIVPLTASPPTENEDGPSPPERKCKTQAASSWSYGVIMYDAYATATVTRSAEPKILLHAPRPRIIANSMQNRLQLHARLAMVVRAKRGLGWLLGQPRETSITFSTPVLHPWLKDLMLSYMVLCSLIWPHMILYSLIKYSAVLPTLVWSCMVLYGLLCMVFCSLIRPEIILYGPIWSNIV